MATKVRFDPRKLMERAVEVMKQSVHETRKDQKRSPAVGAVLVKPDGAIETAFRGELRDGDHAEFTLLERKNRAVRLDGSKLFATLEPCAPGARKPPKLCCAERIALARIKQVWVGIEDPDPAVDRKGIKYLQDHGVHVVMFDRDLQDEIRRVNAAFIAQAEERAAMVQEEPKESVLSPLENGVPETSLDDFSAEALNQYRDIAKIPESVQSRRFHQRLLNHGLIRRVGQGFVPAGFGLLLFGTAPRDVMPQAGLLGTIHYPNGKEETRDFDGPLVLVPGVVEKWLRNKLPNTISRGQMRRGEASDLPFELIREAVVNALVHRDYDIKGAKCQLVITADSIIVKSPGRPIDPITLEQMQSFNAPMLSRNPMLHYVFARVELAEERGFGLKSMKSRAMEAGLPLPKYSWRAPYLELVLYRNAAGAARETPRGVLNALSRSERLGWEWLTTKVSVNSNEYALAMRMPNRTALNHLKHFSGLGLLRKHGSGPATKYEVRR